MRHILFATLLALGACGSETSTHVNALTGDTCEPTAGKMARPQQPPKNDKCQGTSNGDNCDDLSSGKIDCIGDGNSGQGDDKKHNCTFPQPGCDENGCCEDDLVEEPTDPVDDPPPPPEDPPPPPPEDPPPPPPEDDGPIFL